MTKKNTKFKKFITDLVREYLYNFDITSFKIDIIWALDEEKKVDTERKVGIETTACEIEINLVYEFAVVTVYKPVLRMWENKEYEDIEKVVAHELAHIIVEPLYISAINRFGSLEEVQDMREWVTERVKKIAVAKSKNLYYRKLLKK